MVIGTVMVRLVVPGAKLSVPLVAVVVAARGGAAVGAGVVDRDRAGAGVAQRDGVGRRAGGFVDDGRAADVDRGRAFVVHDGAGADHRRRVLRGAGGQGDGFVAFADDYRPPSARAP
ncbi:MAG: hypothetical protein V9G22_06135 [Ottowia sp.]